MVLLDSNTLIYAALPEYSILQNRLREKQLATSVVSKIEVLGFFRLQEEHRLFFEELFGVVDVLPLTESVVKEAIHLRQQRKMRLGDAIIGVFMMDRGPFYLLGQQKFLPLFVTQFLGALNDNVFKNALVMLITYRVTDASNLDSQILVTLAGGLFMLPFFLFSAMAGQLADRLEKSILIRRIKLAEIGIMGLAAYAFLLGNIWFLLALLFLMGTQSTFFGPVKYAILPDHLAREELISGNALVEAGTFLAILIGTIAGGLTISTQHGAVVISIAVIIFAAFGWVSSWFIPPAMPADPKLKIQANFFRETWDIIHSTTKQRNVFLAILGISWFWLVGATYLTQFPTFAKQVIGGEREVVTLFLTVFSVGIGIGSLLCNRLLKGQVSAKYVPLAALGMTVFSIDLVMASENVVVASDALIGLSAFLAHAANWRIIADLLLISVSAGIYIVPLYTIMQIYSPEASRSRVIAGNNILNALFVVVSALITMAMLAGGLTVSDVFFVMAVANGLVAAIICKLLPDIVLKALFSRLLRLFYRVELKGWAHYKEAGDQVIIVVNHVSFLDAPLLAVFLPDRPTFAIHTFMAEKWWIKPFLRIVNVFPLDSKNPFSLKSLIKEVREGNPCVIFPEGRITVTGALMKVYEGPGVIADRANATVLPIRINGAQFTRFSRLKGKVRTRWFPKITLTMLPPRRFNIADDMKGRVRRQMIGQELYDILTNMVFETSDMVRTLDQALIDARAIYGGGFEILEDMGRNPVTYNRLITLSRVLGRQFRTFSTLGERVGLLMPNAVGSVAAFFALQSEGRIPAMLNFSSGLKSMRSACATAQIQTIITSRRFVVLARLEEIVAQLAKDVQIVYLEDIGEQITFLDKIRGLLAGHFATLGGTSPQNPHGPAVVLFTSGSEGAPKGVVLSHQNLLANCCQLSARIDYNSTDIVFNALPIFHAFGLTGGLLLPSLSGIKTFLYPSPLHYRIIPEMVYDSNATILFGTDTFLKGYARVSHPYDYYSVRYVFAGAEKVQKETRRIWMEKFGLRIFEGYGATETSPALSANTAMHYRPGTVGRFLPGIQYRVQSIPGIEKGGQLHVAGPNVMLGYLRAEKPGQLEPPPDGWYDTGDIVEVDPEGFVTLSGRVKRFAKVGGEMVSLAAVEMQAASIWIGDQHAVVSVVDAKRGEQLILVTTCLLASRAALLADAKQKGIAELSVPKKILVTPKIPLLGTGKIDYVAVKVLVEEEGGA